jgi:hypothetical protein
LARKAASATESGVFGRRSPHLRATSTMRKQRTGERSTRRSEWLPAAARKRELHSIHADSASWTSFAWLRTVAR